MEVAELRLRLVGVLDGVDARKPRLEPANVRVVVLQRVVGEADAAAAVGVDQRGRGALAEPQHDQRLELPGRTGLAALADRGLGGLLGRLLGLLPQIGRASCWESGCQTV